jgi:hypothetical protein
MKVTATAALGTLKAIMIWASLSAFSSTSPRFSRKIGLYWSVIWNECTENPPTSFIYIAFIANFFEQQTYRFNSSRLQVVGRLRVSSAWQDYNKKKPSLLLYIINMIKRRIAN